MSPRQHSSTSAKSSAPPAPLFAALGDPTRLHLVGQLTQASPQSISALTQDTMLTRQAISKHLRVLEEVGLVESVKSGRESLFAFRPEPLDRVRAYLDVVSREWDDALLRLKSLVED